ncbi:MAG: shikimate dehydrogenase [Muribaculaceae bacterium]|nr:shikimate dehydrogenase [Muribaculaceae bacterium]
MANYSDFKRLYGLIGYPLGHSFSQNFFNRKFESEKIDARYINFEISSIEMLEQVLERNPNLAGFNITIPYKEKIFDYLDAVDPEARAIGAVNVVKVFTQPDGSRSLKGYNSDSIGFWDSLRPMLDKDIHTSALVLGTGGASKAVAHALENNGIEVKKVSRTPAPDVYTYKELTPAIISEYKIIVNTTPVGMYPNVDECPDIPYDALTPAHICYDLLYNPDTTLFMKKSAEAGASVKNGLEMLLLQAFVSWNIWKK